MIEYVRQYCFVGCFPAVAIIGFDPVSYTVMEGESVSVMVRVFSGQLQTQVSANINTPTPVTGTTIQHSTHVANILYATYQLVSGSCQAWCCHPFAERDSLVTLDTLFCSNSKSLLPEVYVL